MVIELKGSEIPIPSRVNGSHILPGGDREAGILVSLSRQITATSLLGFLKTAEGFSRVYWRQSSQGVSLAGYGSAVTLQAAGENRFREIQEQADHLFSNHVRLEKGVPEEIGPKLFGGFSFRPGGVPDRIWSEFPDAFFILPRYQLEQLEGQTWLTINRLLLEEDSFPEITRKLTGEWIELQWEGTPKNINSPMVEASNREPLITNTSGWKPLMSQARWEDLIRRAVSDIHARSLEKVVLARACQNSLSHSIDVVSLLARLQARYPDCFHFLFEPVPGHRFLGATPELLARVHGAEIYTVALAGSIPRGKTWEEDLALGQQLLDSAKDRHEHSLVVQYLEENLRPIVHRLQVARTPDICRLNNIQHLETRLEGALHEKTGIMAVLEALHPTPALGGFPREAALTWIEANEPVSRGWYGGPIGWVGPGESGQFAVAIRSAVTNGSEIRLYAGAGIVADSNPVKEWQETELKLKPLLEATGQAGLP